MADIAKYDLEGKTIVLCMKGVEVTTGKRLTEVVSEFIDKDKTIVTEFVDSCGGHEANIKGVGDWVSNSLPAAKKACIEFLTKLAKDPDNMFDKIRAYHNKCVDELLRYGVCDHITYAELETKKI